MLHQVPDDPRIPEQLSQVSLDDGQLQVILAVGDFLSIGRDADAPIHEHLFLSEDIIQALGQCRVIAHHGKGDDNIAVDVATDQGILVANVLGASQHEVAEHALALLLSVARKVRKYDSAVRKGHWHVDTGEPLFRLDGKTLGLVGFGDLARMVAGKARSLGMEIIAYGDDIP